MQDEAVTIRGHHRLHTMSDTHMPSSSHSNFASGFVSRALTLCIRAYQALLSPVFGTQCRFYPTCSQYALGAIAQHGAGKGLLLAAGRITRCNPFCEGGHDPVPERFSLLKLKS